MGTINHLGLDGTFDRPGAVLGPRESIAAIAQYMVELLDGPKWREFGALKDAASVKGIGASVEPFRDRLLFAYLMHGRLDATAGISLFDWFLASHGVGFSRREFFGEFGPSKPAPFCHELESSQIVFPPNDSFDHRAAPVVAPEVVAALKLAGLNKIGDWETGEKQINVEAVIREMQSFIPGKDGLRTGPTTMSMAGWRAAFSVDKAIEVGVPLLSETMAAPSWVNNDYNQTQLQVLRTIFDNVTWLPRPKTFSEAVSMGSDEHVSKLKSLVRDLTEKLLLGDFRDTDELSGELRKTIEAFKRKPWAARTGAFLTYISVPIAIGEALAGTSVVGISTAVWDGNAGPFR